MDLVIGVQREDSRRYALENDFHVTAPCFELRRRSLEPGGHIVESRDQHSQFVSGLDIDAISEIARGNLTGCSRQSLNGCGNSLRQEKTQPDGRKKYQDRH